MSAIWIVLAVLVQALAIVAALHLLRRRWERYELSSAQTEATLEAALFRLDERIAHAERLLTEMQPISLHAVSTQEVATPPGSRPLRPRRRRTAVEAPEEAFKAAMSGRPARRRSSRVSASRRS